MNTKQKEEKHIKTLIGRVGEEYYVCDTVFDYHDGLRGATATVFRPVGKAEYDEHSDPYSDANDEALWDHSGYEYWDHIRETVPELTEEEYPVLECIGGGRSFSVDMQWDELYAPEVWETIKQYETN